MRRLNRILEPVESEIKYPYAVAAAAYVCLYSV